MDYKKNVRSPNYGKIFAYDQQGREIKSLDPLKLFVTHDGVDYTISELLETVIELKKQNENQEKRILIMENVMDKVDIMSKLVALLDIRIKTLEIK